VPIQTLILSSFLFALAVQGYSVNYSHHVSNYNFRYALSFTVTMSGVITVAVIFVTKVTIVALSLCRIYL
jgi:hypothetical protein